MEVILLLSCLLTVLTTTANVRGAAIETPPDVIDMDHLTQADKDILSYLEQEMIRKKRSEDVFSLLKAKVAQGFKSKIGHIASASSHASHGKKDYKEHYYHHHESIPEHHHEHHEHHEEEKTFDFWDLKKSIINTLLQAVKAINGGLIAIKGHLIKGGGYFLSAKGKLISAKGEAITTLGKHIASSALLSPKPHKHHHEQIVHEEHPEHIEHEYSHPTSGVGYSGINGHGGHGGHGGLELHSSHHHSAPSISGYSDHKFPSSLEAYKDHLPRGAHQGILILKKIPKGHKDIHNGNDGSHHSSDSHLSHSKPEEPSDLPFKFLPDMKDIFSASSMMGHEDKHSAHSSSAHSHHEYSDDDHSYHHHESHSDHDDHHDHLNHDGHHDHHEDFHDHHYPHDHNHGLSSHFESLSDNHESSLSHYKIHPYKYEHSSDDQHMKDFGPPATNYGTPLALPDNNDYLNKFHLLNAFQNPQSTGGLSNYQTKLETYEPLQLPKESTPLVSSGLSNFGSHGLNNFPSYPADFSQNFGAQHSLLGNFLSIGSRKDKAYSVHEPSQESSRSPDSDTSDTQHEIILSARIPSKGLRNLHRFPAMIVTSDSFKDYLLAQQNSQNRQSSYRRSISRRKRPKSNERNGSYRLGLNVPVKTD